MIRRTHLVAVALLAGCVHPVPPELADARAEYDKAAAGPATELAPADLHKAEVALSEAEEAWHSDPRSYHTADLAYVAQRKAQLAEALGSAASARQAQEQAQRDLEAAQTAKVAQAQRELDETQGQLQQSSAQLAAARQAQADADQRTADALSQLAAVKQDPRGLVITLSGSVLFASDQATLLPDARHRLDQVAEALLAEPGRTLVIEGHTDSSGPDDYNLQLSQLRADAVRDYLVSRGYDASLVEARGMGEAEPVADNATTEGRANNRRVEIVVGERPAAIQ